MKDSDYVAYNLGKLTQAVIDAHIEACRRWGADKAEIVISAAEYALITGHLNAEDYVFFETKRTLRDDDFAFVERARKAKQHIADAIRLLKGAEDGK